MSVGVEPASQAQHMLLLSLEIGGLPSRLGFSELHLRISKSHKLLHS